jgi:hypothetical protein
VRRRRAGDAVRNKVAATTSNEQGPRQRGPFQYAQAFLAFLVGSYMWIDGVVSIASNEYLTPKTGPYARPHPLWEPVVAAMGLQPHSSLVKTAFIVFGVLWLVHASFVWRGARSRYPTIVLSVLTLWYFPLGTFVSILELVTVWMAWPKRRA